MKIKPYYIETETLDEYLDVCKHNTYYRQLCGANDDRNIWYITEYNLKSEDLNRKKIMNKLFGHRPDILKAMKYKIGTICKTHDMIGIFRGVQLTDEDYYWIIERPDGSICYIACTSECRFSSAWNKFNSGDLKVGDRVWIIDKDKLHETRRHKGTIIRRDGCLLFQDTRGFCRPMSDIAFWMYESIDKHRKA